jgi:hypothetical protein
MLQKHSILSFLAAKEKEKYNQLQSNPTWYHQDKTNQPEKCTAVPQRSDKAPDMSPGLSKAQEDISWCRGSSPHTCLWQSSRAVLPSLPPTLGFPSTSEKLSSSVPVAVNCELWLARWVLLWDLLSPASELPLKWDQLTVRPLNGRCEGVRPPEDQRDIRHPGLSPLSKGRAGAPLSRVAIRVLPSGGWKEVIGRWPSGSCSQASKAARTEGRRGNWPELSHLWSRWELLVTRRIWVSLSQFVKQSK